MAEAGAPMSDAGNYDIICVDPPTYSSALDGAAHPIAAAIVAAMISLGNDDAGAGDGLCDLR